MRWWRLAAEQGVGVAQYNLSLMYEEGRGVERDLVQAYRWLLHSKASGVEESVAYIEPLRSKMTAEQLAQTEKLLAADPPKMEQGDAAGPAWTADRDDPEVRWNLPARTA